MRGEIVGLATPLVALIFAAAFLLAWRKSGLGRYVLAFSVSYTFFAIGLMVAVLLPPDTFLSFHASHLAYSLAAMALVWGACDRLGLRTPMGVLVSIYLVAAAGLYFTVTMTPDAGPSLVFSNTGYGLMLMVGLVTLLASPRRKLFDQLIIAAVALNAVDFLVRPTVTLLLEGRINVAGYHESVYFSVINLVLSIKAVSTAAILFGACFADYLERLREDAQRDDLTGLKNRAVFEQEARVMMKRGQDEERPVAMIIADIDHFKQVNDIWGHQAGDRAIAGLGTMIQSAVRGCDISARIGGEEFCIIAWNCEERAATRLAERIRLAFAKSQHEGIGADIRLTASFGVAGARSAERYEDLFKRADAALYRAKEGGRNQVVSDRRAVTRDDERDDQQSASARSDREVA